jgi:adenylate cyclase
MTANNKCVVLVNSPEARLRIDGWLIQAGLESVHVSTADGFLNHPLLLVCPLVVLHVTKADRVEVCRQLRERTDTALLPIVVFAASDMWRQDCYEAGADAAFIRFTLQSEINARIRALTTRRQFLTQCTQRQLQAIEQDRDKVWRVFRRYVSPQLADEILSRLDADLKQVNAGTRTQASVLFADMRGFTGMAEKMPPTQVFELLNEFFTVLTAAAFEQQGTVFSMAGDSLMVGFGVPLAQEDAGLRAVRAAQSMLAGFGKLAKAWRKRYGVETGLGIGINSGEVVAGNIGSEQYMNYTLIGDTVNVAARLSQRARAGEVLFSNALKVTLDERSADDVPVLALPPLTVRGRVNPIDIYCVPTDKRIDLRH